MTANNIGGMSYSKYPDYDTWPYKVVTYLLQNNQMIWKLLYNNTPDAWNIPDLTLDQKRAMIWKGNNDPNNFNVFMDIGKSDVTELQKTEIHISNYEVKARSRTTGVLSVMCEVYTHWRINTLSNSKTRIEMICGEFLSSLNGTDLGIGLGKFYFDWVGDSTDVLRQSGSIPFKGKFVIFSNNIGG